MFFQLSGKSFGFEINKLDRKKLYGWKETVAVDHNGNECIKAYIDDTGSAIIPKGGMALGIVDEKGNWVNKSLLQAVNIDGSPAELVLSSFDAPIELKEKVSVEEFLNHNIQFVYMLEADENSDDLLNEVKNSKELYTFVFNYRTDYEGSTAFLIETNDKLFALVGYKSNFEFIGLEEAGVVNVEEQEDFSIEDDLDFGMM